MAISTITLLNTIYKNHRIDWDSAECVIYSTDYYQRLIDSRKLDGQDGNGLQLEKVGASFSSSSIVECKNYEHYCTKWDIKRFKVAPYSFTTPRALMMRASVICARSYENVGFS